KNPLLNSSWFDLEGRVRRKVHRQVQAMVAEVQKIYSGSSSFSSSRISPLQDHLSLLQRFREDLGEIVSSPMQAIENAMKLEEKDSVRKAMDLISAEMSRVSSSEVRSSLQERLW